MRKGDADKQKELLKKSISNRKTIYKYFLKKAKKEKEHDN